MLYNQTFNLDQVAFATEGIKDAQQTVRISAYPSYTGFMSHIIKALIHIAPGITVSFS